MKTCKVCKTTKDLNEFGLDKRTKDGLSNLCIKCAEEKTKRLTAKKLESKPKLEDRHKRLYLKKFITALIESNIIKPVNSYNKNITTDILGFRLYLEENFDNFKMELREDLILDEFERLGYDIKDNKVMFKYNDLKFKDKKITSYYNEMVYDGDMKKCKECGELKPKEEFYSNKMNYDKLMGKCKDCYDDYHYSYKETVDGFINVIYTAQRTNSIRRNMSLPSYTKDELKEWILKQPNFNKLFKDWKDADKDLKKDLVPSVDRINSKLPYDMNNIQLVTYKENRENWYEELKNNPSLKGKNKR